MKHRILSMILTGLCLSPAATQAQGDSLAKDGIGVFTAVVGAVTVAHSGIAQVQPVKLHDEVLFKDVIETHKESRTKAFFEDDSVLTVGENSRVEVTEHIYNPDQNQRRMVVNFTSGGTTVTVAPGEYSVVGSGGFPTSPAVYDMGSKESGSPALEPEILVAVTAAEETLPPQTEGRTGTVIKNTGRTIISSVGTVNNLVDQSVDRLLDVVRAIEGTVLKDMPKPESAIEMVRAILPVLPISPTAAIGIVSIGGGSAGTPLGQIIPEGSSASNGSAAPVAALTSSLTSTLTSALAPVTSVVSTVLAPVTPVVSTVLAPVTPVVSAVLAPVTPVVSLVPVAPVTAVVSPVIAPVISAIPVLPPVTSITSVVPVAPVVPVTPPAVISGVTGILGLPLK